MAKVISLSLPEDLYERLKKIAGEKSIQSTIRELLREVVYGGTVGNNKILQEILSILKRLEKRIDEMDRKLSEIKVVQTAPKIVKSRQKKVGKPSFVTGDVAQGILYSKDITINNELYTLIVKRAKTGKVNVFLFKDNQKVEVLGEFTESGFKLYENHIENVVAKIGIGKEELLEILYQFVQEYTDMVYRKIVDEAYNKGGKISTEEVKRILEEHGLSYERFKIEHPTDIIQEDENTWSVVEAVSS